MIKKILIILLLTICSNAFTVEYGKGSFGMEGGFLGLNSRIDCDISTFTIKLEHSNINNFYYGFNFTWFDSDRLRQSQKKINSQIEKVNQNLTNFTGNKDATIPEIQYRMKGLDANLRLGYDIIHKDKNNYLGAGVLLGFSFPVIDSDKGDSVAPNLGFMYQNAQYMLKAQELFAKSKTKFSTYKIGPAVSFKKSIIKNRLFLFGSASYAFQKAQAENSFAHMNFNLNGTYQSLDIGLKYIPFPKAINKKYFTLNKNLYITAGYRYNQWELKEAVFDISGSKISSKILNPLKSKFKMDSSAAYVGVGYSF